ncbi:hypothetical protein MHTCC0001_14440 [Flavobacteriaceae bacterium MHTCC 0001]
MSCSTPQKDKDITLLEAYLDNYRIEQKKDSIFLGLENYNGETLKIIEKHNLRTETELKELKDVFTGENYKYFKKQLTKENSVWGIDFSNFNNVFSINDYPDTDELKITYLSKPIYTINEEYALIQKFHKTEEDISFISSVEVFKKEKGDWKKISKISHY